MSNPNVTELVTTADFIDDAWRGAAVAESGDVLLGTTLSSAYQVERVLGEGGMGRVYLARHTRIAQKRVAVKVLHARFAGDGQVLARFQREAEAAASIAHPNVMAVLDVDRTPHGLPYLVCEYLEGIDLGDHLKAAPRLDLNLAVHVARQLCRGLAAAHESGVIHRDLKPQNVFLIGDLGGVAPRPLAKLLDFGLSRFRDPTQNQELTTHGLIMGTPSYMAPEQARARPVDNRVDVYGVGAILYVALTGRPPFDEESPQATVLAVMTSDPARPRAIEPGIPAPIELVIQRAMAREPDERYANMAELEQALEQALEASRLGGAATIAVSDSDLPLPAAPSGRQKLHAVELEHIGGARLRLVLLLGLGVVLSICAATTAISGVELAVGYAFDRVELGLILGAIALSSLTPAVLWVRHVRRKVWQDGSRVLLLLRRVRAAVLAFAVSYGLGVLALHVVDDFLVRLLGSARVAPVGAGWAGWSLLLPALALAVAAGAWQLDVAAGVRAGFRRVLAVALVVSLTLGAVGALIALGLSWRAGAGAIRGEPGTPGWGPR